MCTPALPKPSPAKVAARAISPRASRSSPSRTALPERPGQQPHGLLRPHVGDRVRAAVGHSLLGACARSRRTGGRCSSPARGTGCPCRLAAVTPAGWVRVRSGSTTASVGRSRAWLMPVLTFSASTSSTQIVVLSDAGPGGGGHGDQRLERLARRRAPSDRGVDVVHQLAGVGGEQVDRLGGVDARPTADGDEGVPRARCARVVDRLLEAGVGRLDVHPVVDAGPRCRTGRIWSATRCGWPVAATPGSVTTSTRRTPYWREVEADLVGGAGPNFSWGAP